MQTLLILAALTLPATFLQGASDAQLTSLETQYTELRDTATQAPPEKAKEAQGVKEEAEKALQKIHYEQTFRTNIVKPLCQAEWGIAQAKAIIRDEKSNPSGVVNLYALHSAGETLKYYTRIYRSLLAPYATYRHHPYKGSETEGTCQEVAE